MKSQTVHAGRRDGDGRRQGDHAWLDFTAQQDGKAVIGMATVERSEGRWHVSNIEVRQPD